VTRTIGLIGGMTPESTLEYYQLLIRATRERLRDPDPLRNPVIIVYSLDLAVVAELQRAGRIDELATHLAGICETLRAAGAEIGALTANTPHLYIEAIQARTRLELVSIVEATCRASVALGLRRPLLLGTRTTMESPMYRDRLAADGIELLHRLRELPHYRTTPMLVLSDIGSEREVVRALEAGADDCIRKPFSPTELLARVERLLKRP